MPDFAVPGVEDYRGKVDGAGVKNTGLPLDLIPPQALEALAGVYRYGAQKYARNNWLRGYAWSLSYAACLRHLFAWYKGEDIDPESGQPHLAHAMWHLTSLLYWSLNAEYQPFDDRVFRTPSPATNGAGIATNRMPETGAPHLSGPRS